MKQAGLFGLSDHLKRLSATRTRSRSLASAVLRFRFAPPAASTGQGGDQNGRF